MLSTSPPTTLAHKGNDIAAEEYRGFTIIRRKKGATRRRILYLNSYGMAAAWRMFREGTYPGQHLWGCLELVRMGYEIAMPEEPDRSSRFYNYRRQDAPHIGFARNWLGKEGLVYAAHTVTFWMPLLRSLHLLRCPIITLLYARGEHLRFVNGYSGVIAMTPAATDRAQQLAPAAAQAYLSWGVDLSFFPLLPYNPHWFLSCGKTRRDFEVLAAAAALQPAEIRVINTELPVKIRWPANVKPFTGGDARHWPAVSYQILIDEHYAGCTAALVLLEPDSEERYAAGFTQMLEAMALARPVIVTRTGAIPGELDVEKEGCGLFVPPNDALALAEAIKTISGDPARAEAMGRAGRRLCEARYNIHRYARDLHQFFESL